MTFLLTGKKKLFFNIFDMQFMILTSSLQLFSLKNSLQSILVVLMAYSTNKYTLLKVTVLILNIVSDVVTF